MSRCAIYFSGADGPLEFAVAAGLLPADARRLRAAADQSDIHDGEIGLATTQGWHVVFANSGPFLDGKMFARVASLSQGRTIFCWLTQSASGGLWFELSRDGVVLRKWFEVDGRVEHNFGNPLPEELPGMFGAESNQEGGDEWDIVDLAGKITGISDEELFAMPFDVYSLPGTSVQPEPRPGMLARILRIWR